MFSSCCLRVAGWIRFIATCEFLDVGMLSVPRDGEALGRASSRLGLGDSFLPHVREQHRQRERGVEMNEREREGPGGDCDPSPLYFQDRIWIPSQ